LTSTTSTYSWDDDGTCDFTGTGDHSNAGDPMLGALGDNGGPTETMLPETGSPLIDAIPLSACEPGITTDQRALARPSGAGCDIGAVEVQVAEDTLIVTFTG
jgi:hypothetical protein